MTSDRSFGPALGLGLALGGALFLSPDALFMRLSGMEGFQMTGWRGMCMGGVMWLVWLVVSRARMETLRRLLCPAGAVLVVAQIGNSIFFSLGIALAPVAIVLIGVATLPVLSALLSGVVLGERTAPATWITAFAVMCGIALAVAGEAGQGAFDPVAVVLGGLFGLATAFVLAVNFVTLRARPDLPILPAIGTGALIAGAIGWGVTGAGAMTEGAVWAIVFTGAVILPVSFFALSLAARYTQAANVSLLMLLETVLGSAWVWVFLGERPAPISLFGGVVVIGALALYLVSLRRVSRR